MVGFSSIEASLLKLPRPQKQKSHVLSQTVLGLHFLVPENACLQWRQGCFSVSGALGHISLEQSIHHIVAGLTVDWE